MPQQFETVQRTDLNPEATTGNILTPHGIEPTDRTEIDELLAETEAGQRALAQRLGQPALASTLKPKPNLWDTTPLADDMPFARYCHETSRWLEAWE